ncbi:MAG: metallophosphoesterase [Bacteroidota bacterium]|nr:metallophosphoesterase [Bacteroidota bacterium]
MKRQFIIFFSIVLTIYAVIHWYIFLRGWNAFALLSEYRGWILAAGILLASAFPVGRILERFTLSLFSEVIVYIGAVWLAEMVYLFLFIALVDILRVINFFIPFFPSFIVQHYQQTSLWAGVIVLSLSSLITAGGFINARFPRIKILHLATPGKNSSQKELNIAVVSDIHLGTIMGKNRLGYIVDKINSLNPDIVLLPGDVFDEDIGKVIKNNLGEILRTIKSKYGTYAVTGNHEYFGDAEQAVAYLRAHDITVLRDEAVNISDVVTVIGREDVSSRSMNGKHRKSLQDILSSAQHHLPTIVLDHQPFHLEEPAETNIDLQLSGHTHHGQLWPFNFITNRVYEVSWGYKKKMNTHIYVSCGAGSWGPPVRTGNRPEIVNVRLRFV